MSEMPAARAASKHRPRAAAPSARARAWRTALGGTLVAVAALAIATRLSMRDFPDDLQSLAGTAVKSKVLARDGTPLSYTLENTWNTTDVVPLADVPTP